MFEFWFKSKSWNLWALSVNFFWLSPKNGLPFRTAPLAGNFRLGSWWKILGWSLRRRNSLRIRTLHCQYQVLEESENQTCKSKTEFHGCAIKIVIWNVKDLMETLMEQIKTGLIWDKMILSIETLSILLKHSLEILECSISGVRIEIGGFSIESSFTIKNFLIVIFSEKEELTLWKKTGLNFDVSQKTDISEHFQSISLLTQPKGESFFSKPHH